MSLPRANGAARVPMAIRLFHWSLAVSFVASWALESHWRSVHEWLGYAAAALVCWRLGYALVAKGDWSLSALLHAPQAVLRHGWQLARGQAPLAMGYNPIAAWNILAMLAMLLAIAASGFALTTDHFWGDEAMEALHGGLVQTMWLLVGLHLLGVGVGSLRSRAFLPRAMWDGRRPPH